MADEQPIDLDEGLPPARPGKMLTMLVAANLLITVALVALLVLGIGPFGHPEAADADTEEDEEIQEELRPAIYESMDKPIVANFRSDGRERYLQLVVQFMTRSDPTVLEIRKHMPAIVDAMYVELGKISIEELQSNEGREMLRQRIFDLTQAVLTKHAVEEGIEEVLFTTYVFQ